jgi:hypothetical protein
VVSSFIHAMLDAQDDQRTALAAAEPLARIGSDKKVVRVCVEYGIDPLAATRRRVLRAENSGTGAGPRSGSG